MKKTLSLLISSGLLIAASLGSAQESGYTIAFVPGVNPDPFYITMASGVNQAAADLSH